MKAIITFFALMSVFAIAQGLLQNEDFKTEAQLITAGGVKAQLLNDSKIYVTANGINKRLDEAIIDGEIGGSGANPVIQWELHDSPPLLISDFGIDFFSFDCLDSSADSNQNIYAFLIVPASYQNGTQILIENVRYIGSDEASFTFIVDATLLANNETLVNTNFISTQVTEAIGVGEANKIKIFTSTIPLTNASGQINSIAVTAGSIIRIKLTRRCQTSGVDQIKIFKSTGFVNYTGM